MIEAPRRIARALVGMNLLPEGGATDYSRVNVSRGSGGHGKHGATTVAPTPVDSLASEWDGRLTRIAEAMEHELDCHKRGARREAGRRARDQRLVAYVDRSPQFVAFVEDLSTEGVRKWRLRRSRDPETGRRLPKIGEGR